MKGRRGAKRRRSEEAATLTRELEDLRQYRANLLEAANNHNKLLQAFMRHVLNPL